MRRPANASVATYLLRTQVLLLGLLFFAAIAIPMLSPTLIGLSAVVAGVHIFATDPGRPLALLRTPLAMALGVFISYLVFNSIWAVDQSGALTKSAQVLLLAVCAVALMASFSLRSENEARDLAKAALIGAAIGIAVLAFELFFEAPIRRFLANQLPQFFGLASKKVITQGNFVRLVDPSIFNRNVANLMLLLAPTLLLAVVGLDKWRAPVAIAIAVSIVFCVLLSHSGTATVALIVAAILFGLSLISLPATRAVIMLTWIVGIALAVPLASLPHAAGWQTLTWLPPTVATRFNIWALTAEKVSNSPVIGIGIRGTRIVEITNPTEGKPINTLERSHAHNVFLQTWRELGAIGALLLLLVGLAALWEISFWPSVLALGAYVLFGISCAIGASGFDLWHMWQLAGLALAWAGMTVAKALPTATART